MLMIDNQTVGLREFYADQATHAYNELDFQLAERLFRQALAQSERTGVAGKDLAGDISNVARACHQQAKFSEAEQYYRRAVSLLESSVGVRHPDLADVLHDLARIKCTLGEFIEGRQLLERAIAIRTALFGEEDKQVLAAKEELISIPNDAKEESVGKHLPVAKELNIESEPFQELTPPQSCQRDQGSITRELNAFIDASEAGQSSLTSNLPNSAAVERAPFPAVVPLTSLAAELVNAGAPVSKLRPELASIQEMPRPIDDSLNQVLPLSPPSPEMQPAKIYPIAFEAEAEIRKTQPFFDISGAAAAGQKATDFGSFTTRRNSANDSSPRRRLPRSLVGESAEFSGRDLDNNYDSLDNSALHHKGIQFNFSLKDQGSRFWQYVGIGVAFQIIVIILIAAFAKGS